MKIKMIMIILFFNLLAKNSFAQNFGDPYQSVLRKIDGIIKRSKNEFIKYNFNVPGIEGMKIYGFNSSGELFSLITQQFLNKEDGKALYDGYYNNYRSKFGTPYINNVKRNGIDEDNSYVKINSKWSENKETLSVNYYTISNESLVQTHYIIKVN